MALKEQITLRIVLYEGEGAQPLEAADRLAFMTALLERGFAVTRTSGSAPVATPDRSPLLVFGKFAGEPPQAEAGGIPIRFQDINGFDPARLAETVEQVRAETNSARHGEWKPWFPVIDYDRCTNCMQCLSFCLFGVYGVDEQQRIQVQTNE